jgi:hypothetical protein
LHFRNYFVPQNFVDICRNFAFYALANTAGMTSGRKPRIEILPHRHCPLHDAEGGNRP